MTLIATLRFWLDERALEGRAPAGFAQHINQLHVDVGRYPRKWLAREQGVDWGVDLSPGGHWVKLRAPLLDAVTTATADRALVLAGNDRLFGRRRLIHRLSPAIITLVADSPEAELSDRLAQAVRSVHKASLAAVDSARAQLSPLNPGQQRSELMGRCGKISRVRFELAEKAAEAATYDEAHAAEIIEHLTEAAAGIATRIAALEQYSEQLWQLDREHRDIERAALGPPQPADLGEVTDNAMWLAAESAGDEYLVEGLRPSSPQDQGRDGQGAGMPGRSTMNDPLRDPRARRFPAGQ